MSEATDHKKRVMFLSGEDFYFFTYTILIALDALGCCGEKQFKDHRKLAYLLPFVADSTLVGIVERAAGGRLKNRADAEYLFDSYSNGIMRESEVSKLLLTLEKKDYITLRRGTSGRVMDVALNKEALPNRLLSGGDFEREYTNMARLRKVLPRLSRLTRETFLTRLYDDHGVRTWSL